MERYPHAQRAVGNEAVKPRPTVLIVDDTPENILILMENLRDSYNILAATNGEKALELARRESPPDLVLLDVVMPGMNGHEVCRELRNDVRTANIPVIFITALHEEEDETRGFELGAVDFIAKPFSLPIVRARVRNHLELKRHRDHLQELVNEQVALIGESHLATIFALSKLAESRDDDTGKHLERTQIYCQLLAKQLSASLAFQGIIDDNYVETIFHASPLHDIGKVAIPDMVLCKPAKLTPEEFAIMRQHTTRGADTLAQVAKRYPNNDSLNMGLEIARWHHEKWNGTGYPDGIAGHDIPLCARIMAVADVYDALTSRRCYKQPMPHEEAMEIILRDSGTHFDPAIAAAFQLVASDFNAVRAELGS